MSDKKIFVRQNCDDNKVISFEARRNSALKNLEKFTITTRNDKYGLIDRYGKEIIPFIYDDLSFDFTDKRLLYAVKNKKEGVLDTNGYVKIPVIYSFISERDDGIFLCTLNKCDSESDYYMGLNYLIDSDGRILLHAKMSISQFVPSIPYIYKVCGINEEESVFNVLTNTYTVFPGKYTDIPIYSGNTRNVFLKECRFTETENQLVLLNVATGEEKAYFDKGTSFEKLMELEENCNEEPSQDYALVIFHEKKGVVNSKGKFVIPLMSGVQEIRFQKEYKFFEVRGKDIFYINIYGAYSENGKLLVPMKYTQIAFNFVDKIFLCEKYFKYGYYNFEGKKFIPVKYSFERANKKLEKKLAKCK